ncbi:glycosyltransferase involved in cell wall biosynthesis [Clostridium algifaecis]|uniref:Glycosyltransferase involved in cell wall biosynthesis n=1 Tax=Clostridium algifaecis TaxID=1472040 RepID=A0ABS4KRU8_9CLOT|nr:glycosyltransferase family 1 protein [Clostridium algifaecis]MBP2032216.1 glycosyltransferase involved in cell wall biosynthesis [Clostridium algifaecis]
MDSQKLNVIIDARMVDRHLHGIARYTYEIIKNMSFEDKVHMMLLVNNLNLSKEIFGQFNNIEFIKMKSKFLSLSEQIELPLVVNKYNGKSIFHSPSFVASPFIKTKMIMTIHDLNHLRFPKYYSPFHKYYYKYIVKPSALKCKKILTVSEFSKNEIVDWLKCDRDKVVVTYNGVDNRFKYIDDNDKLIKVKNKYNLPNKFILYIGNLKPHKNVRTLIRAMSLVDNDIKLVINGKINEPLMEVINTYNLKSKIRFIGYVDDEDLPILYNLANVFIFPSLYEGFGLPPLEAMACGCPVIVSNTSSLPEVVGDAGEKFEAEDYEKLAELIKKVLDKSCDKQKLIERSKLFNWEKTCDKTFKIYYSV